MDKIDLDKELNKMNGLSEKEVDKIFENDNLIVVYYLIKHVRLSTLLLCKCFSCLIKYNIVGKGWVKCTYV